MPREHTAMVEQANAKPRVCTFMEINDKRYLTGVLLECEKSNGQ